MIEETPDRYYQVGRAYRDRAGASFDDDEFLRWLKHEKTIGNAGGVRWRDFLHLTIRDEATATVIPAYFVLVTVQKHSQYDNPWVDVISPQEIRYWGDAKLDSVKSDYLDFRGNRRLLAASHSAVLGGLAMPPILHFTKLEEGWVQFNGLCLLAEARVEYFADRGKQVANLLSVLRVVDVDMVSVNWLQQRSAARTLMEANNRAPAEWTRALVGGPMEGPTTHKKSYREAIAERALETSRWSDRAFDPTDIQDGRARVLMQIAQRQGQGKFRHLLLLAYEGTCAITGCTISGLLEACHIRPYRGKHTNGPRNGILLRADVHNLFDLGLLGIEPDSLTVVLSLQLAGTEYSALEGLPIRRPKNADFWPSVEALRLHRSEMAASR